MRWHTVRKQRWLTIATIVSAQTPQSGVDMPNDGEGTGIGDGSGRGYSLCVNPIRVANCQGKQQFASRKKKFLHTSIPTMIKFLLSALIKHPSAT